MATPGPCFRVSENEPILFLKQVEGWNPFMQNGTQNGHDSKKLCSVSFIIILTLLILENN